MEPAEPRDDDGASVRNEIGGNVAGNVVQTGSIDTLLIGTSKRPSRRRRLLMGIGIVLLMAAVVILMAPVVRQAWLNQAALDSPPPPAEQGGGGPPVPTQSDDVRRALDNPCMVVMANPDMIVSTLGHNMLPSAESGPAPTLPSDLQAYADGTCVIPLADSAGELHVRLVDLKDQGSVRKVFDLLGQWEATGGSPPQKVSGLLDDARQGPNFFIVRRADRVLAMWYRPSDVATSKAISLEALGRLAATQAWSR